LAHWEDIDQLKPLTGLQTIYLERNPIWRDAHNENKQDPNYRRKLILALPWIKQIDATYTK
jgi:protein phosphatase 1 regulatory subunit 7